MMWSIKNSPVGYVIIKKSSDRILLYLGGHSHINSVNPLGRAAFNYETMYHEAPCIHHKMIARNTKLIADNIKLTLWIINLTALDEMEIKILAMSSTDLTMKYSINN